MLLGWGEGKGWGRGDSFYLHLLELLVQFTRQRATKQPTLIIWIQTQVNLFCLCLFSPLSHYSLSLSLSFYFQGKGIAYLRTLVWIGLTRRLGSAFHNLPLFLYFFSSSSSSSLVVVGVVDAMIVVLFPLIVVVAIVFLFPLWLLLLWWCCFHG